MKHPDAIPLDMEEDQALVATLVQSKHIERRDSIAGVLGERPGTLEAIGAVGPREGYHTE